MCITNVITLAILIFIAEKAGYLTKAKNYFSAYDYQTEAYRNQTDMFKLYKDSANIVMLGSSYTARVNWNELLGRHDITNRGIDGDVTAGLVNRLDDIQKLRPKVCFIEGGRNDIFCKIPLNTTISNLRSIVKRLKGDSVIPVLTTSPYNSNIHLDEDKFNMQIDALNKAIKQLAAEENLQLIDLNAALSANNQSYKDYLLGDGIHFKSNAYVIWKKLAEEILQRLTIH